MTELRRNSWLLVVWFVAVSGCRNAEQTAPPATGREDHASPAPSTEIFTDIALQSGLDFVHNIGATGEFLIPESMGGGCALWDYDNDGDLDIYLIQGALLGEGLSRDDLIFPFHGAWPPRNRMFRNDLKVSEDGKARIRFTDVTDESGLGHTGVGMGCAVGDYDNDGWLDLYLTNFGSNAFYRNLGNGTFEEITSATETDDERWSTSAAFLDYDRDGFLDLFVVNYVDFQVGDKKQCFDTLRREYCGPKSYNPVPDRLFRNNRDGTFSDATHESGIGRAYGSGLGVSCSDFNNDGWMDLYIANDADPNQLWINQRDQTFENTAQLAGAAFNEFGQPEAGMGVAIADFDGDADEDIFLTHLRGESNTLYVNQGDGFFLDRTDQAGLAAPSLRFTAFGVGWLDYDNDGRLDLFIANGDVKKCQPLSENAFPYGMQNQLFRNQGNAKFAEISQTAGSVFNLVEASRSAAFGDVDNDGDTDVLLVNANGPVRLLRNEIGQNLNWVNLRLVGLDGKRDAIGARVGAVLENGSILWRRVHADGSYQSSSDLRVHFGLNNDLSLTAFEVHWPDGSAERFEPPPIRSSSTLRKGHGKPIGS